jgi:hypothetical protein
MNHSITIKNTKTLAWGIGFIAFALFILMAFSIERTAWLISIFESGQAGPVFGYAAAIIIEIAAIAFIAAEIMIAPKSSLGKLVMGGLILILVLQSMANGVKGWINGWEGMRAILGSDNKLAQAIAGAAWLVVNGLIPLLIFILSKLLASFIAQLLAALDTKNRADLARRRLIRQALRLRRRLARLGADLAAQQKLASRLAAALDRRSAQRRRIAGLLLLMRRRVHTLRALNTRYKGQIEGLESDLAQEQADHKATAADLAQRESEYIDMEASLKGQLDSAWDEANKAQDLAVRLFEAESDLATLRSQPAPPEYCLESVAAWIVERPEATIANLAAAVRAIVPTDTAAAQAFGVSYQAYTGWAKKAAAAQSQPEAQQLIEYEEITV